ncbi:MAG: hypothetical protein ABUL71_03580, partial [Gemmatimonadota bacterium]
YLEVAMILTILAFAAMQGPVTLPSPPVRYRIEAKTTADQDLTSIGRGKVTGSLTSIAFVSVTTTDSAEGQVARVVVDSMTLEPVGAMTAQLSAANAKAAADSARGLWVHAYTVKGTIRGTPQPSSPNPALAAVMQAVGVLFPGIRTNIKLGDAWADTTKIDSDVQGGHQTGRIVATWKVVGNDDGAFVLDGTSTSTVTTNGQAGQVLTRQGTSRERLTLAPRGPARNASIETTTDASMVSQPGAAAIPAKNTAVLKVTQLP